MKLFGGGERSGRKRKFFNGRIEKGLIKLDENRINNFDYNWILKGGSNMSV